MQQGRLHYGEWCEMHHGENCGGGVCDAYAFARVYNNLLWHEYIYYFTPVHFLLAVCHFFNINLPISSFSASDSILEIGAI